MDVSLYRARLIRRSWIRSALLKDGGASARRAVALINLRGGAEDFFRLEWLDAPDAWIEVVRLRFDGQACTVGLNRQLLTSQAAEGLLDRLLDTLLLFADCRHDEAVGTLMLNIGDFGLVPGLAFSDARPEYVLIPDPYYVNTVVSADLRSHYPPRFMPWRKRQPVLFWRGSTTGQFSETGSDADWREMDRIRLCRIAAEHPDLFDVGITGVLQVSDPAARAIRDSGYLRPHVRMRYFHRYRYQLDIDGNTNSWGCFNKLLTGSTLLKVASRGGYRQWYYNQLQPWAHFVPVASDLSDLAERVQWVRSNDEQARLIGEAGRELAISMTLASSRASVRRTVAAALSTSSTELLTRAAH